jgi:hypothetical protein
MATSSSIAFRRSPEPGAFTAATCSVPRSLLTTIVTQRLAFDVLGDDQRKGRLARAPSSSTGRRSFIELIYFSWVRIAGFSRTTSMRSGSVTKYAER